MKTIDKITKIFDVVDELPGTDQSTISRISGLSPSTVSRICKTLVMENYLIQSDRKYFIGKRFTGYKKQNMDIQGYE